MRPQRTVRRIADRRRHVRISSPAFERLLSAKLDPTFDSPLLADSRGSLCSPKAGFGRLRLLPRKAAYGLGCELTQPAMNRRSLLLPDPLQTAVRLRGRRLRCSEPQFG